MKVVENFETRVQARKVGEALPPLDWKPEHVAFVRHAMFGVTQEGTSRGSFLNAPYQSGGKTGTAQVIGIKQGEKYNARNLDERHRDNALYTAFAPVDEPRIALALIVENAGFGAGAAAPIARRVFDFVLSGLYPSEADIAATRLGQSTAPIGQQRPIASVPLPGTTVDGAVGALGPLAPSAAASAAAAAASAASAPQRVAFAPKLR